MHYYKRNIGDYYKKAGRLSILQHGAYTLLIDACYDREVFPTMDDAIEWVWASSDAEVDAVKFVLRKFFTEEEGLFVQSRIQEDLDKYHANSATNKRIAIEREKKKKLTNGNVNSTNREQVVDESSNLINEAPPNQEPLTINQEPITIKEDQLTKETVNDNLYLPSLDSPEPKPKVNFAVEDLNFAHWFYERLLLINPKHKKPSPAGFDKWAGSIRKLRAIDGKSHQEMSDLFMWVNNSEFWKGNILSPAKLRTQWDMLTIQRNKDLNAKPTKRDINAIGKDFYVPEGFSKQQDLYKD